MKLSPAIMKCVCFCCQIENASIRQTHHHCSSFYSLDEKRIMYCSREREYSRKKSTMHLDVGLALPQALLLVHVGRHLPPLLVVLLLLPAANPLALYLHFRRTHPPATQPREREQQFMQAGLVWTPPSTPTLCPTFCFRLFYMFYLQMKGKDELLFRENELNIQSSGLGNNEVHAKQIENSCRLSERPRSNRFWTFKRYPFTFLRIYSGFTSCLNLPC